MAHLRYFLLLLIWGLGLLIGGPPTMLVAYTRRSRTAHYPPVKFVIGLGLRIVGIKIEIEGLEKLDPNQTYLFLSNHQSILDIPAAINFLPGNVAFLAKKEHRRIPILSQGMRRMGMVFIDRRKSRAAVRSIQEVAEKLKQGISFVVFVEGTRSEDGRLLPFKRGPFFIALESQAAIVPMTMANTYQLMPKRGQVLRPGKAKVIIHDPISTKGLGKDDIEWLIKTVHERIASGLPEEIRG